MSLGSPVIHQVILICNKGSEPVTYNSQTRIQLVLPGEKTSQEPSVLSQARKNEQHLLCRADGGRGKNIVSKGGEGEKGEKK